MSGGGDKNLNNIEPKFEFAGGAGFTVGTGQSGEDENAVTAGVESMSLQVTAPAAADGETAGDEDEEENDMGLLGLGAAVLKRVAAIRRMHIKVEEIDEAYKLERLALEKKFLAQKQVIMDARNKIISGEEEPVEDATAPENASNPEAAEDDEDTKGIPGFWLACLMNHPTIGELITEEDVPALEALADIKCEYADDYTWFKLTFFFKPNPFFTNSELSKKYVVSPDLLDDKAPALSDCSGSDIEWKEGKNLCVTEVKKKQKAKSGRSKGQVRTVVTTQPKHSFFHYFSAPMTDEEADEEEENGNEEEEPIKLTMEEDYDIGHVIRTSLIPEAVLWYTGEAIDDEDEEGEDGDDDDDDDDEGDDDDDLQDAEDDEEDEPSKPKGKKNKPTKKGTLTFTPEGGFAAPGGGAAGAGGEQPECKQA